MACELTIYDLGAKTRQQYVCDEDNTGRMVEDDHAASATGQYTDAKGKSFSIDWTKHRLVAFKREA